MPDWSYQPFLRPVFAHLPPGPARATTLRVLGALAAAPGGSAVIDFMGHMRPPTSLGRTVLGRQFPGPIGLGAGLDVGAMAVDAFARFGFGYIEVGPVALAAHTAPTPELRLDRAALYYSAGPGAAAIEDIVARLDRTRSVGPRRAARLVVAADSNPDEALEQVAALTARLAGVVDFVTLGVPAGALAERAGWAGPAWATFMTGAVATCRNHDLPLLLVLPPDMPPSSADTLAGSALAGGAAGIVIAGGMTDGTGRLIGAPTTAATVQWVGHLRRRWGEAPVIVAGDGVVCPADALAMLDAGADLVQLDAGLVLAGPGLPKRCNEALLAQQGEPARGPATATPWWLAHLGLAAVLFGAGVGAMAVALTTVVLPYDLSWLRTDRTALTAINLRLLDFMRHDRTSLAGTLISLGVLYGALTLFGERRGVHWARQTMSLSNGLGLASFFLFLIHGYIDPLHAVLFALCLVLFLTGLRWPSGGPPEVPAPDLTNDNAWRRAVLGQLFWIVLAIGLVGGGVVIALLGSTRVFVPEDLAFMNTTHAALAAANPRLLPLIAHDRAGFGGALAADGLALLGVALWGVRRGARWVWLAVAAAGLPALAAGLGVHAAIGYKDPWHLAPAFLAATLYLAGLVLSRRYLWAGTPSPP